MLYIIWLSNIFSLSLLIPLQLAIHFFLLTHTWSVSLCSVISKVPISLQIQIIRFWYPLLVGLFWTNHLIASFFISFIHLLLSIISTSGSLSSSLSACAFFLSLFAAIGSIKTLECFIYTSLPFSSNPKNHSSSSLSLYVSQLFLWSGYHAISGYNFSLPEASCRPSDIGILPLVAVLVARSNFSWGIQLLTCRLSAPCQ